MDGAGLGIEPAVADVPAGSRGPARLIEQADVARPGLVGPSKAGLRGRLDGFCPGAAQARQ